MSRHNERDLALDSLMLALADDPSLMPATGNVAFLNAMPQADLKPLGERLLCRQGFKPRAEALQAAGFKVTENVEGPCGLVLLLPDRQKEQTLADFAKGMALLEPGGALVVSLHNDWGAKRFEKHLAEFAGEVHTLSKFHCRAFWVRKTEALDAAMLAEWSAHGELRKVIDDRFWSVPGVFSWNQADEGSKLLLQHLPKEIHGKVADLGAGWGFLSDHLLRNYPDITLLELFEADRIALDCARRNLGLVQVKLRPQYHWSDVTRGVGDGRHDFVIMNPPFHDGRAPDHLLGVKFIAAAAKALKPGGQLWMVANRNLPYEKFLGEAFTEHKMVIQSGGFKVLTATK